MAAINKIFRGVVPQVLHVIVLPVFFFAFMLIYRPFGIIDFLGREWFAVHLTMLSCIILLGELAIRSVYYFLALKLNYLLYVLWCFAEIIFISFFVALYIWLVLHSEMPYFEVVGTSFKLLSFVLVIPYTIIALSLRLFAYHNATLAPEDNNTIQRIRFYDNKHNLKIVLASDSILYISAEQNYVTIVYVDNGIEREYTLRTSMKAIDELCQENGLVRCHRSYYINPSFVKVLRKDKEGVIFAEMDSKGMIRIPVSKTYYDHLSELLC